MKIIMGTLPHVDMTHSGSDKLQKVSKRNLLSVDTSENCQDLSYVSNTTEDVSGIRDGTSEKCHRRPHTLRLRTHNKLKEVLVPPPGTHNKLQEVSAA